MRDRLRVRLAFLLVQQATARGRSVLRENKSEQDLRDVEFFSETKSKENRKTLNVLTVLYARPTEIEKETLSHIVLDFCTA